VRRNRQLTPGDLSALEQMLVDAGVGDPEDLARASEQAHGFGLFVRSLVGLERDAAAEAFSRFLDDRTHTRAQIDFVWVVVTHLTERGVMDVELLYEPPFTDHAPHGPEDLFSGSDVDALVDALTAIRATAGPAEGVA
jgi:type I restriction enzyme R subunit